MGELRDAEHPYGAKEGNYFARGHDNTAESWADFLDEAGGLDPDLNLLYRWDWERPDPDDYEPDEPVPGDRLLLFFMAQRNALAFSWAVPVTAADEPAIRQWLTERARTMAAIWTPIDLSAEAVSGR